MLDYYRDYGAREICHGVKNGIVECISEMAGYLAKQIKNGADCILIPVPQHTGRAEYTKQIANLISNETGAVVADVLACKPRKTRYEMKYLGVDLDPGLYLLDKVPNAKRVYILDNVIGTGKTMQSAQKLITDAIPLVYAKDTHITQ